MHTVFSTAHLVKCTVYQQASPRLIKQRLLGEVLTSKQQEDIWNVSGSATLVICNKHTTTIV